MVYIHQQTALIPISKYMYTMANDLKSPSVILRSYSRYYPFIVIERTLADHRNDDDDDDNNTYTQITTIISTDDIKSCKNSNVLQLIAIRQGVKRKNDGDDYCLISSPLSHRIKIEFDKLKPIS